MINGIISYSLLGPFFSSFVFRLPLKRSSRFFEALKNQPRNVFFQFFHTGLTLRLSNKSFYCCLTESCVRRRKLEALRNMIQASVMFIWNIIRGDRKLIGDEQPLSAHPENWLGIRCTSVLEFFYTQTNELA